VWRWVSRCLGVVVVLASLLAAAVPRWSFRAASLCLFLGAGLAVAGCLVQIPALRMTNSQMQSEDGLSNSGTQVTEGMLLAAAPAALLALRLGRMRLPLQTIVVSGFWGVWLPLTVSVALIPVAKMCGARLHWKPSLPVDVSWAFVWITRTTEQTALFLWPLAASAVPALLVLAVWPTYIVGACGPQRRKLVAGAAVVAIAYPIRGQFLWDDLTRSWLWSIVVVSVALGVFHLAISIQSRRNGRLTCIAPRPECIQQDITRKQ
jgi:hypothetical protein